MNNLPMKVFNYGQKEYTLYYDIIDILCTDDTGTIRKIKKELTPFSITINRNIKLIYLLKEYKKDFDRWLEEIKIKKESRGFENNYDKKFIPFHKIFNKYPIFIHSHIIGYSYTLCAFKIKKSFLSYIIQDKERLKNNLNKDYDIFVKQLSSYFESVNTMNDDDFNSYINDEVRKLMCINYENEIKRLNNEVMGND